ncbi:MAG: hypothetical protein ABJF10_14725 [Chthoniobacter sp.]|uniref:hypothetical protein n=1 Tax=Chthoniobacter sp. TaxID=2510640 RepID=UPI0032AE708E
MKSSLLPLLSRSVSALAVCAVLGGNAFAQAPATPAPAAPPAAPAAPAEKPKPLAAGDEAYVKNAVKSLSFLIQVGKLLPASTAVPPPPEMRLKDATVKDMTLAQTALNKIVEAHGLKIPTELVGADKSDLDRVTKAFSKPPIKGFETKPLQEWVGEIVKESKRLDRESETIGKTGVDADLKTFATNYGPSVRNVFTTADKLEKALKAPKKK